MQFTYYGHACFSIKTEGKSLLFDPFITPNPLASGIDINQIEADFILVSHGHEDHIADCISIAKRTGSVVISNWEICNWLNKNGVENTLPMNTGGQKSYDFGTIKCVAAQHSSSMPDGSYGGNPHGFLIKGKKNIYYSGDTALTLDMQLVAQSAPLHTAILSIGDHFTMGYEDAAKAAHMIQCREVIGVHFDTFPYIAIDKESAINHFKNNGLNLVLPAIGETINL
jgi:L-ascorbate metabolism protein UlaG (beta-lactamase superfamily)